MATETVELDDGEYIEVDVYQYNIDEKLLYSVGIYRKRPRRFLPDKVVGYARQEGITSHEAAVGTGVELYEILMGERPSPERRIARDILSETGMGE